MPCPRCGSKTREQYPSEIAIHQQGSLATLHIAPVIIFPQVAVCLECGFALFDVPAAELNELLQGQQEKPRPSSISGKGRDSTAVG